MKSGIDFLSKSIEELHKDLILLYQRDELNIDLMYFNDLVNALTNVDIAIQKATLEFKNRKLNEHSKPIQQDKCTRSRINSFNR